MPSSVCHVAGGPAELLDDVCGRPACTPRFETCQTLWKLTKIGLNPRIREGNKRTLHCWLRCGERSLTRGSSARGRALAASSHRRDANIPPVPRSPTQPAQEYAHQHRRIQTISLRPLCARVTTGKRSPEMETLRLDGSNETARQPKAVAAAFIGQAIRLSAPASTQRLVPPPLRSLQTGRSRIRLQLLQRLALDAGTTPLTSQPPFNLTTPPRSRSGSNAARLRLSEIIWIFARGQPPIGRMDDEACTTRPRPHSFSAWVIAIDAHAVPTICTPMSACVCHDASVVRGLHSPWPSPFAQLTPLPITRIVRRLHSYMRRTTSSARHRRRWSSLRADS